MTDLRNNCRATVYICTTFTSCKVLQRRTPTQTGVARWLRDLRLAHEFPTPNSPRRQSQAHPRSMAANYPKRSPSWRLCPNSHGTKRRFPAVLCRNLSPVPIPATPSPSSHPHKTAGHHQCAAPRVESRHASPRGPQASRPVRALTFHSRCRDSSLPRQALLSHRLRGRIIPPNPWMIKRCSTPSLGHWRVADEQRRVAGVKDILYRV